MEINVVTHEELKITLDEVLKANNKTLLAQINTTLREVVREEIDNALDKRLEPLVEKTVKDTMQKAFQ